MELGLASKLKQVVSNKNSFSQSAPPLVLLLFHQIHREFAPGQDHPSPWSYTQPRLRSVDMAVWALMGVSPIRFVSRLEYFLIMSEGDGAGYKATIVSSKYLNDISEMNISH